MPWAAAVGALSLLVIGLAAWQFTRTVPTAATVRFTVSPPPQTTFYDFADPVRISPDGQRIAFVVRNAQNLADIVQRERGAAVAGRSLARVRLQ
jgi:hypothetical protein